MNASDEEALGAASIAALHAHFIELLQTVGKSLKCRQRVVATSYVVAWVAGLLQTGLYIDFFWHYFKAFKANKAMTIPQRVIMRGGDAL